MLYLPSIPFGAGAFGLGDVKLLVGRRACWPAASGPLGGRVRRADRWPGVVLLVAAGDHAGSGGRTYVPFGPFLIIGALWAVLIRP